MIVGIDASNLIEGGGVTHLVEIISAANPKKHGIRRIIVWGRKSTITRLPNKPWLEKRSPKILEKGRILRLLWQRYSLEDELRQSGCDLLFVPGGNYPGKFRPFVTMSRNMLPFDSREISRYGLSIKRLRLETLRLMQAVSFRRANGLIFLTNYARDAVLSQIGKPQGEIATIPHGVSIDFSVPVRRISRIEDSSFKFPFKIIYVSHASPYKHQWNVIEALAKLRKKFGWNLRLDMIGPLSENESVSKIYRAISLHDPESEWAFFHGPKTKADIRMFLESADFGIFASSCENMPNVLLEKMASGLPLACSNRGPMPEILNDSGIYFDPEDVCSIMHSVEVAIKDPVLRDKYSRSASARASIFSWVRCADDTFAILRKVSETNPIVNRKMA